MKFTRVKINNFLNLKDVDLDLTNGNTLIVGPNGSGKTNIIKCIQFLICQIISKCKTHVREHSLKDPNHLQSTRPSCDPPLKLHSETAGPMTWNPSGKDCCIEIYGWFNKAEIELFSELRALFLMAKVCDIVLAITKLLLDEFDEIITAKKGLCHQRYVNYQGLTEELLKHLSEDDRGKIFLHLPDTTRQKIIDVFFCIKQKYWIKSGSLSDEDLEYLSFRRPAGPVLPSFCVKVTNELFTKLMEITKRALLKGSDHDPLTGPDVVVKAYTLESADELCFSSAILSDAWLPTMLQEYKDEEHRVITCALHDLFGELEGVGFFFEHGYRDLFSGPPEVLSPLQDAVKGLVNTTMFDQPVTMCADIQNLGPRASQTYYTECWQLLQWMASDQEEYMRRKLRQTGWGILLSKLINKLQLRGGWTDNMASAIKYGLFDYATVSCMERSTVNCILPQTRGVTLEGTEPSTSFTINSLERVLIKSKLSDDETVQQQLRKVKDGMKSFCGIKIDIQQKKEAVTEDNSKEAKEVRNLCEAVQEKDKVALYEFGHRLSSIGREMIRRAPSWYGDLRVMVTRTLWSEDSSYSHMTPLSGLSGGEIEILMVLCTIHLSGADTVFLDEPGHSLHPPQQAQLCRWIETLQHPDPVCVLVTHSVELVSRKSLNSLYHMSFVKAGFTPFKLSADSTEEKQQQRMPLDQTSGATSTSESAIPPTDENKETVPLDRQADVEDTSTLPPPTSGTAFANPSPKLSVSTQEVALSREIVNMLMRPDMRKMFFANGLYFVEGETDKVVLSAVRQHLLKNARDTLEKSKNPRELLQAVQVLEMDQWDILALGGCAEAMKAYRAAAELRIPCAIVLDLDTITVKHGKRVEPFTSKTWISSRLYKALTKERQRNSLEVAPLLLDKVDAVFAEGRTQEEALSETRKILQEYGIWIWESDLESVVCDNTAARQQFLTTECFMEALGEHLSASLSVSGRCSMPTEAALDNYDKRILAPLVPLVDELRAELDAARARLCENSSQRVTEDMQNLVGKIGKFKQRLEKHDDFCEKGTKRRADWPPNHKGSTKKSAGDPSQLVHSHQDDVSMSSETTQPPADEGATGGLSYVQESDREKIMWDRIKHKLHNEGGWMKLPWETLCKVVEVCLEVESSPLQDFCRFMKKWQCKGKKTMKVKDLPRSLLSKLFDSIEDDAEH